VQGDLRFVSHRDMMRIIALAATRAGLALRYTQGFNPHPQLSLACPRPVGMTAHDDMLVVVMDESVTGGELLDGLNAQAPEGMRFSRADMLDCKPQPTRMTCRLPLDGDESAGVGRKLAELARLDCWPIKRRQFRAGRRDRPAAEKTVDLRPMVERIELEGDTMRIDMVPCQGRWARPAEVLDLVGLDARADLARMIRSEVQYRM